MQKNKKIKSAVKEPYERKSIWTDDPNIQMELSLQLKHNLFAPKFIFRCYIFTFLRNIYEGDKSSGGWFQSKSLYKKLWKHVHSSIFYHNDRVNILNLISNELIRQRIYITNSLQFEMNISLKRHDIQRDGKTKCHNYPV